MADLYFKDTAWFIEILCCPDNISYSEDQSFSCFCLNNQIICQLKDDRYPPHKMQQDWWFCCWDKPFCSLAWIDLHTFKKASVLHTTLKHMSPVTKMKGKKLILYISILNQVFANQIIKLIQSWILKTTLVISCKLHTTRSMEMSCWL